MIISVASGKGGTGKTTIAVNLALSISSNHQDVSFLDCDVEEPNAHIFLKPIIEEEHMVEIPVPQVDEKECTHCGECARICRYNAILALKDKIIIFPDLCHGCGGCMLLCPAKAISEKGRVVGKIKKGLSDSIQFTSGLLSTGEVLSPSVIREVKRYAKGNGVNIIDSPPGTSCPFVESVRKSDFCLLVTEPTPFGINDLKIALQVIRELKIPSGVVLNKSSDEYDVEIERFCTGENVEILMKIPWNREIAMRYSIGVPLVEDNEMWKRSFYELFEAIKSQLSRTEIVEK